LKHGSQWQSALLMQMLLKVDKADLSGIPMGLLCKQCLLECVPVIRKLLGLDQAMVLKKQAML